MWCFCYNLDIGALSAMWIYLGIRRASRARIESAKTKGPLVKAAPVRLVAMTREDLRTIAVSALYRL